MDTKTFTEEQLELSQAILDETDHKKRWRMVHDLLRQTNKIARREQDKQAKAMKKVREAKVYNTAGGGAAGMRFGVSVPNVTYQAIVESDMMVEGTSRLRAPEKQKYITKDATNQIVKDLEEVFPEYKASE